MQTVPLTLLAAPGPSTQAYLAAMNSLDMAPEAIIDLRVVPVHPMIYRAKQLLGLKTTWRIVQALRVWKNGTINPQSKKIAGILLEGLEIKPDYFHKPDYKKITTQVHQVWAYGLNDPVLVEKIRSLESRTYLYTAGGIMPPELLDIPGKRFIHIHPGVVPHIKGGDGLLWSILVRGRPGMSCFYMNKGIDTGDIIVVKEFENPSFKLSSKDINGKLQLFYSALLNFYDPALRANMLAQLLQEHKNVKTLDQLPSRKQDPTQGRTYFTMHTKIRDRLLARMLE